MKRLSSGAGSKGPRTADPTAQLLERLERGATERLPEDANIDPPAGKVAAARYTKPIPSAGDEPPADKPEPAAATPSPAVASPRRWTVLDAAVCVLAISILGLSLWAIRWVAAIGRA